MSRQGMREQSDDREQPKQGRSRASNGQIRPLPLRFNAQMRTDLLKRHLSGKRLARYLDRSPARFQPLPIGTAREVFPQAARPVGFTTMVMSQGDTGSDFH